MTKKSNCLFWAWKQWREEGGYLCFRVSKYWAGVHVLWLKKEGGKFWHFTPKKRFCGGKRLKWWQWPLLLFFEGEIKQGNTEEKKR